MSDKAINVKNAFFEDDEKNIFFYYTGKDSIMGLQHPDCIFRNEDKYTYARVAFCKYAELGDDAVYSHIDEVLEVTTFTSTTDVAQVQNSQCFQVHVQASGKAGKTVRNMVRCSVTDLNVMDGLKTDPEVIISEDTYTEKGVTKYGLGVWVNISGQRYVLTRVIKSISANLSPLDNDSYPSSYTSEYLSDDNANPDVNVIKVVDFLNSRKIVEATPSLNYVKQRLDELEKKNADEPHQYLQNSVVYDPAYIPKKAKTDEIVTPTGITGSTNERIVVLDNTNKIFKVRRAGVYMLQLKNGFYIDQGESRVDLKVLINSTEVKEMGMSSYLVSHQDDPEGKVIKNIYSSNAYVVKLQPTDQIKLMASWMDITNISVENESMITVTALQYNLG